MTIDVLFVLRRGKDGGVIFEIINIYNSKYNILASSLQAYLISSSSPIVISDLKIWKQNCKQRLPGNGVLQGSVRLDTARKHDRNRNIHPKNVTGEELPPPYDQSSHVFATPFPACEELRKYLWSFHGNKMAHRDICHFVPVANLLVTLTPGRMMTSIPRERYSKRGSYYAPWTYLLTPEGRRVG